MKKIKDGYIEENNVLKYFISNKNVDAKNNKNLKKVLEINNFNVNLLQSINQVHGTKIKVATEDNQFSNEESDAIVTNKINTPIMIYTADCVPIIFYDEINKVVALAHAGWKGTFDDIVGKVVDKFVTEYNSELSSIKIVIGPHITLDNYEVSKKLIDKFSKLNIENYYKEKDNKYFLNLFEINLKLLIRKGIKEENIKNTNFCTVNNNDEFYSYRKNNKTDKRIATVIQLKGENNE